MNLCWLGFFFSTWLAVSSTLVLVALISSSSPSFDQVSLAGWWSTCAWLVSNILISAVLQTPWSLCWHSIHFTLPMHYGMRRLYWLPWILLLVSGSIYPMSLLVAHTCISIDGFGFMLAFGLYTWVPMNYTLQARYLVDFPRDMSYYEVAAVIGLNCLGYFIFRSANSQKNAFRMNPDGDRVKRKFFLVWSMDINMNVRGWCIPIKLDLKYLKTERGTKLIISSWWGMSRHINYLGDWLMALSWSLPCGFGSIIPYFYPIYFAVLLLHRERRDDHQCRIKYGKDWDKYCSIVKSRIIPGLFINNGWHLCCRVLIILSLYAGIY